MYKWLTLSKYIELIESMQPSSELRCRDKVPSAH